MPPVRSRHPPPPVGYVVETHSVVGRREDERARHELLVGRLGSSRRHLRFELIPVNGPLGRRDIAGGIHERAELGVRDFRLIDPETMNSHPMRRPLGGIGLGIIRAHQELAARNPGHARWSFTGLDRVRPSVNFVDAAGGVENTVAALASGSEEKAALRVARVIR